MKGTTHLSTFLGPIATVTVPAGFTPEGFPVGITFFGRGFSEAANDQAGLCLRAGGLPPSEAAEDRAGAFGQAVTIGPTKSLARPGERTAA